MRLTLPSSLRVAGHCFCLSLGLCFTGSATAQDDAKSSENPDKPTNTADSKPDPESEKKPETKPPLPDPAEVEAAMKKAALWFRREASFAGGYPTAWAEDRSEAFVENRHTPSVISIQPPGTTTTGLAYVEAWQVTRDEFYLQAARETAQALAWCQLSSGGWDSDYDFNPAASARYHFRRDLEAGDTDPGKRRARSTLDDNKTESALLFLVELSVEDPRNEALQETVKFGFDGLLAAQAPNGGWPQGYSGPADPNLSADLRASIPAEGEWSRVFPAVDYTVFYTLNDGNIHQTIRLLIRAHELTGEARYLESAKKAGDFLILAQLPDPQPAWAQQYNFEMQPCWARKFEPPSVSSIESLGAVRALFELYLATGEKRFLEPIPSALAWLKKVRLEDGRWARFYELSTDTPLYCVKDTYEITYDDSNMPTHYGFKIDSDLIKDIENLEKSLTKSREDLLAERADPDSERRWTSKAKGAATKARTALAELDSKGRWISDDKMIEAGTFSKHMRALATYLKAARNGREAFEEQWKASQPPAPQPEPEPKTGQNPAN